MEWRQAIGVGAGKQNGVARGDALLEELGHGDGLPAFFEGSGAVADDGELDQAGEQVAGQGESADDGVVAACRVGEGAELERGGRRQLAQREGVCGQGREARVRSAPVDATHFFAGANAEPAGAQQVAEREPSFTSAKVFAHAGLDAVFARAEVGEAERALRNLETARLARERQALHGARFLEAARDERHVAARSSGGDHEAIAELTASMQANGQVAGLERELLRAQVGFDEANAERAHLTCTLLAAFAPSSEQRGIAVEGQRLTLKELCGQAREMSAARADVDDTLGARRQWRERAE